MVAARPETTGRKPRNRSQHDETELLVYSVPEAGRLLGLSRNAAYEAAKRGDIPTLRIGRLLLVPKGPFHRMVELTTGTAESASTEAAGGGGVGNMTDRTFNPAQRPTSKTAVHITGTTRTTPVTKLRSVDEAADLSQLSEGSIMTQQNIATSKTTTGFERLLTTRDAAAFLRLSHSWLAKARVRGDGPPYVKIGRSIRYSEATLVQWLKSKQRLSTTEQ